MGLGAEWLYQLLPSSASTGVDVGSRMVKIVQLKTASQKVVLDQLSIIDLADSNPDYPKDTHLSERLKASLEANELTKKLKKIRAAGSNGHVQYIDLTLPKLPKKEFKQVIANSLEEQYHRPLNQLVYDTQIISESDTNVVRVFYSELAHSTQVLDAMIFANLRPLQLSASFLAIAEMLEFNDYTAKDKAVVVVEIGELSTSTILLLGPTVLAAHTHPAGLASITGSVMNVHGMDYSQAESLKRQFFSGQLQTEKEVESTISNAFTEVCEGIQKSIDYYQEQDIGTPISEILLTGGGSAFLPFSFVLESHYRLKTSTIDPFRNIETLLGTEPIAPELVTAAAPFAAVAVGLALGGIDR